MHQVTLTGLIQYQPYNIICSEYLITKKLHRALVAKYCGTTNIIHHHILQTKGEMAWHFSCQLCVFITSIHSYVIVKSKGILAAPNNTAAKSGILTKCFDEKAMFIGIIMPWYEHDYDLENRYPSLPDAHCHRQSSVRGSLMMVARLCICSLFLILI